MSKKEKQITRKDFLKKSYAGLTGLVAYDVLRKSPLRLWDVGTGLPSRTLGRCGIEVTVLGYGASRSMEPSLLLAALERGINFVDTGRSYFNGNNERMVGDTLQGMRKNVVIQSKMRVRIGGEGGPGAGPETIRKAMDANLKASLKALKTDYIDIMLIHDPGDVKILKNETVQEFLTNAKKKGILRAFGFSCHNENELLGYAAQSAVYDIIMLPFNHKGSYVHMNSGRSAEWDQPRNEIELKKAQARNLGVIAMKTCSAGPYASKNPEEPSFAGALRWVLDHDFVSTAAVAMSNVEEIQENTQALRP